MYKRQGQLDDLLDTLESGVAALHAHLCHLELVDVLDEVEVQQDVYKRQSQERSLR